MTPRPVRRRALFGLLLLPLALHGCYTLSVPHTIAVAPAIVPRPPQLQPIPVAVGIYFSPEFLGHGLSESGLRALGPVSTLGDANRRLLEAVFAQLFETVVPVPAPPPLAGEAGRLAAVIVPAIESFELRTQAGIPTTYTATVAYRLTLLSPDGETIAAWTVKGLGERRGVGGSPYEIFGIPAEQAVREAGRNIVSGFREVPGVPQWLDQVATSRPREGPGPGERARPGG